MATKPVNRVQKNLWEDPEEVLKRDNIFNILNSQEELVDWVFVYFEVDLTTEITDKDSTSCPAAAMWTIYNAVKTNSGETIPGYIMLSARAAFKTLVASMTEVLLLLHFKTTISHLASIKSQSKKAISYVNKCFVQVRKYTEYHGWINVSSNESMIRFRTPSGSEPYIVVIVCTMAGANCIDPGSLVKMSNGTHKRAAEILPGDRVLSWDARILRNIPVTVKGLGATQKYARRLNFEDGSSLVLSDDHPLLTRNGWICASQVRVGEFVKPLKDKIIASNDPLIMDRQEKRSVEQLILGTLLGDSSIQELPSGSCRYTASHTSKHDEYIQVIRKVLESAGIRCQVATSDSKDAVTKNGTLIRRGRQTKLSTEIHSIFKELNGHIKVGKRKTPSLEWLNKLTDEGLSYWFMDDGSGNSEKIGTAKDHNFRLATCGFTYEENQMIAGWFQSRGYEASLEKTSNQSKKIYWSIKFSLESSRRLSQLMSPYFVTCLRYKLLPSQEEISTGFTIDTMGKYKIPQKTSGFQWGDKKKPNRQKWRQWARKIKLLTNLKVTSIDLVGLQDLVDVVLDTKDPMLKCFYANDILVHNSEHTSIAFYDEVETVQNPAAYQEAMLIPAFSAETGIHPITVKLSTRKHIYGLMNQQLEAAATTGEKILRWNILDITERCPSGRYAPNKKKTKVSRYIARRLPFRQLSPEQFDREIPEAQKNEWEKIEAYEGCLTCPLLPVCKTDLSKKTSKAVGGLYKPISSTINDFKKISPDVAEAQLLCWRPSSKGLIYSRFESDMKKDITRRNIITIEEAYETLMGVPLPKHKAASEFDTMEELRTMVNQLGLPVFAGGDFGYRHAFSLIIGVIIPNGDTWIVETFSESELELDDQFAKAKELDERWNVKHWFVDQAYPGSIKKFESGGLKCPKFVKDVMGGIEAVRGQIVDASNRRRLKVIQWERNEAIKMMFRVHHFKLNTIGNPTEDPDDEELADVGDATRYLFQCLFSKKKGKKPIITMTDTGQVDPNKMMTDAHLLRAEIKKRSQVASDPYEPKSNIKRRKVFWSF